MNSQINDNQQSNPQTQEELPQQKAFPQYFNQNFQQGFNPYQAMQMFQNQNMMAQQNGQYRNKFPRATDYSNFQNIVEHFPHLKDVNKDDLDIDQIKKARCIILRSNNDDDIHKSIKYGIWTSTPKNNIILSQIYNECKEQKIDFYLFFSVVKSGQFVGVAKMTSDILNRDFSYWWQSFKFPKQFELQWVFIKDLPYKSVESIQSKNNISVIHSKDSSEIEWIDHGERFLQIFKEHEKSPNIFQDFDYMDQREDMLRTQTQLMRNPKYKQQLQYFQSNQKQFLQQAYQNYSVQQQQMQNLAQQQAQHQQQQQNHEKK